MTGNQLGRWVIDTKIGQGAMGEVYRAHDADHPEQIAAVKILVAELARDPAFLLRFQGEIDILRQLDHPRIIRYLDSGIHEGVPYFVMEYLDGQDYDAILRQSEPRRLPWTDVLDLAIQIVPALQHAHRRGVIHRDLKPSNILRRQDGVIKLTDFGIARMFAPTSTSSSPQNLAPAGSIVGAIAFAAPEQALGKPLTKRSDFYALGGVLYSLITGRPPFTGNNVIEVMHKHCFQIPERPSHYVPQLPKEFEDFILRLLAKDPGLRPGDGGIVMKELLRIRGELERRGLIAPLPADQKVAALAPLVAAREFDDDDEAMDGQTTAPTVQEPGRPLMNRPQIVIPLAIGVFVLLGTAIHSMIFPATPEERFESVAPLLERGSLEDLEQAWRQELAYLADNYPDFRREDVQAVRQRIDALTSMRRAIASGQLATTPVNEVDRQFRRGLSACQAGDYRTARELWRDLVRSYRDVPSAQIWVEAAQRGIDKTNELLEEKPPARRLTTLGRDSTLQEALQRIREHYANGRRADGDALLDALRSLYRGDVDAPEILPWLESQIRSE